MIPEIDALIRGWYVDLPVTVEHENKELFLSLISEATSWMRLIEVPSYDWRPDSAHEITHQGISDERVEELVAGAPPDDEELEFWREEVNGHADFAEIAETYILQTDDGHRAWFVTLNEGLYGTHGAAGPFLNLASLRALLIATIQTWDGWHVIEHVPEAAPLLEEIRADVTEEHDNLFDLLEDPWSMGFYNGRPKADGAEA